LDDEDAALYALPPLELPAAALLLGGPSLPPPFCVPTSGSGRVLYRGKFEGVVVACKRCSGVGSLAGDALGAFNREVNILADLGHPNVLQVLGLCVDAAVGSNCGAPAHDAAATRGTVTLAGASGPSGTIGRGDEDEEGDNEWTREPTRNDPLVVTVLCGGGTLAEYYPISFFFTPLEFGRVAKEVLAGVDALHARGCAHRDLRPANVLLEPGSRTVKLAGFHLARPGSADPRAAPYAAPETHALQGFAGNASGFTGSGNKAAQAAAHKALLRRAAKPAFWLPADVYSAGLLLWELWFRRPPFQGEDAAKLLDAVAAKRRPPLFGVPGAAPPPEALAELIEACWAPNPKERPPMVLACRALASNQPPAEVLRLDKADKQAKSLASRLAAKRASIAGKVAAAGGFSALPQSDERGDGFDGDAKEEEELDTDVVELPGASGPPGGMMFDDDDDDDDAELDPEVAALLARLNFKKPKRHSVAGAQPQRAGGADTLDRLFGSVAGVGHGSSPDASREKGQGSGGKKDEDDQPELFFEGMDPTTAALLAKLNFKPKEPPPRQLPASTPADEPAAAAPEPGSARRRSSDSSSSSSGSSDDEAGDNSVQSRGRNSEQASPGAPDPADLDDTSGEPASPGALSPDALDGTSGEPVSPGALSPNDLDGTSGEPVSPGAPNPADLEDKSGEPVSPGVLAPTDLDDTSGEPDAPPPPLLMLPEDTELEHGLSKKVSLKGLFQAAAAEGEEEGDFGDL
jgi:serine/threonine protein kinase